MSGFLQEFKAHVAEELPKNLQPLHEGLTDLAMRTHEVEAKIEDTASAVHSHDLAIQELREQIKCLEEAQEDLSNRSRRNNILIRGIPETISMELLQPTLTEAFQSLLPESLKAEPLMDRAHRALRSPAANTQPQDVIVRMHDF
ncbi:Hypothetical predicted protein [Pelobates cultripes]|uniref:Uncharacterized protein n=1 Tax=Pelobates cultripes TaxID=61616 RepID=A0AAD1VUM3_PELCU|nr:Hypothetical predicted protein [Pelobates cultripes]